MAEMLVASAGVTFRLPYGAEDAEALFAVHQARQERDGVDPLSSSEDWPTLGGLRRVLARVIEEGTADEWCIAEWGGEVVGYSESESWCEDDGTWVYLLMGWVVPSVRGQGIGTALLHRAEEHARVRAAAEHPGERFEFAANASSTESDATALLLAEGYRAGYTVLEMELDPATEVPLHPLPTGFEIRAVAPEHVLPIACSIGEAYAGEYEGGRYGESFDPATYAEELRGPHHDPTLWRVAWDGDQIAGQVLSVIVDGVAEVIEVSVRPAYRRRGLARALLSRALRELQARSVKTIRLRTVAEFRTRASDLYRSVGFRVLKEFPRYRKPV